MKSRLSSTIWTLVLANGIVLADLMVISDELASLGRHPAIRVGRCSSARGAV